MKVRPAGRWYFELQAKLNTFLADYKISAAQCDVFEETLLKAAGVETQPQSCLLRASDFTKSTLIIEGINSDEAECFIKFLRSFDAKATVDKQTSPDGKSEDSDSNTYAFQISTKIASKKVFPCFQDCFRKIVEENPAKIETYQSLSQEDESLLFYKLLEDCQNLKNGSTDNYVSGKLQSAFELVKLAYVTHENNQSGCVEENAVYAQVLLPAISLLIKTLDTVIEHGKKAEAQKIKGGFQGYYDRLSLFQPAPLSSSDEDNNIGNKIDSVM